MDFNLMVKDRIPLRLTRTPKNRDAFTTTVVNVMALEGKVALRLADGVPEEWNPHEKLRERIVQLANGKLYFSTKKDDGKPVRKRIFGFLRGGKRIDR